MTALLVAVFGAVLLAAGFLGFYATRPAHRKRRRRQRDEGPLHPVVLAHLERPVRLPPGHPEAWSEFAEPLDLYLADLHDRLWPGQEYLTGLRGHP